MENKFCPVVSLSFTNGQQKFPEKSNSFGRFDMKKLLSPSQNGIKIYANFLRK